jgi:S-formylglutathione hydrolase FrmB
VGGSLGAAGSLVWAAAAGRLDRVPLLNGPAAVVIECLGAVALIGSWWSTDRRWVRRTLPLITTGSAVATVLLAAMLNLSGTVTDEYPPSFAVWVGLVFVALVGLPLVLRAQRGAVRGRLRRIAAATAVPLTMLGTLMLIDNEYGVWPQVGDLLGHNHAVSGGALSGFDHTAYGSTAALSVRRPATLENGLVVALDPPGTSSHFRHRAGVVYLPPVYFRSVTMDLPVLIMLGGSPGTPLDWMRAGGAEATVKSYAATHHGVAPVLIAVDINGSITGDSECVNGPQGNVETYLTEDVPAFMTATLHLRRNPARWGVVGFSEGGTCALDLAVTHQGMFRHFVDLSGDTKPSLGGPHHTLTALFGGSRRAQQAHDPLRALATHRYPNTTGWFAAGAADSEAILIAHRMSAAAQNAGITQHELTVAGGHDWRFAAAAFAQILPQLCTDMGCGVTTVTPRGSPT